MNINYEILEKLLNCNKNIKLKLSDDNHTLDISNFNQHLSSFKLKTNNIEDNSEDIYNHIISLDGITLYIPKVYIQDK